MPCRCDYMEATEREEESRQVCILLKYLLKAMNIPVSKEIEKGVNYYGDLENLDKNTDRLCGLCNDLSEAEKDKYIYNGKNKDARRLADWWDEHQLADKKRILREEKQKQRKLLVEQALAKLTPEEQEALKIWKK